MATKKAPAKAAAPARAVANKRTAPAHAGAPAKTTSTKRMSKTELVRLVAEEMELTTKQSASVLDLLAETALQETKRVGEFAIPGLGKLVKAERAARIGRNPQTGESIKIKAKIAVKFRVAKAAKDAIAPTKK